MTPFSYTKVTDARAAIDALVATAGAKLLAGGTTLVDLMKLDVEAPSHLVDVNALPLAEIHDDGGALRIGAMVKNSTLAHDPRVVRDFPVLSQALLSGASPQLRNMASVGGNLLQRTRCPYLREPATPCNKRVPGSGCGARDGYNRSHAVLGTSEACIATHPSDFCVALVALDAIVRIEGPEGARSVPLRDFYLEPGATPERENVLQQGDLIVAVDVPALSFGARSTYLKVRDRASYEFALTSAAVALSIEDGVVRDVRVALGGVGTRPWRATKTEQALIGKPAGRDSYRDAAREELATAVVHEHNAFKVDLAIATITRALEIAEGLPEATRTESAEGLPEATRAESVQAHRAELAEGSS